MDATLAQARAEANWTRYRPGQGAGHYESFFQRANHPTRPQAFWIRYTVFSPAARPEEAVGELWAVSFDGETGRHVAVKQQAPFRDCTFAPSEFSIAVAGARLGPQGLQGAAASSGHRIAWDLAMQGGAAPLFLLPLGMYTARFPKAKSLAGLPLARFDGTLDVDGATVTVENWIGSQNHNWGTQHTDHYAWGQVAGFDDCPESFLEIASARLRFGPLWTPFMTPIVLRHAGEEFALNALAQTVRASCALEYFTWRFRSETRDIAIAGEISAPRDAFAGLRYANPPGGEKHCLNTKLAACTLTLRRGGKTETLACRHRAAFEILTDDRAHGIALQA